MNRIMTDQQTTSEMQTQQPHSGNGSELSGLVRRTPPRPKYCDECRHDLGYQAGMIWPPYRKTCGLEIDPTKITKEGRLVKYGCKEFAIKSKLRA